MYAESRSASGPGHQLENVPVRVAEVDAPAAIPGVELLILEIPWLAAECESCLFHSIQNGVELRVAYMKRVVMDVETVDIVVEIKSKSLIDSHRGKYFTALSSNDNPNISAKNLAAATLSRAGTMV